MSRIFIPNFFLVMAGGNDNALQLGGETLQLGGEDLTLGA